MFHVSFISNRNLISTKTALFKRNPSLDLTERRQIPAPVVKLCGARISPYRDTTKATLAGTATRVLQAKGNDPACPACRYSAGQLTE